MKHHIRLTRIHINALVVSVLLFIITLVSIFFGLEYLAASGVVGIVAALQAFTDRTENGGSHDETQ